MNLLPLPVVLPGASAGGLPPLLPSLHCLQGSLFLQAGWVHRNRVHGECVLLQAPGMDAEDTRVHTQTALFIRGGDEDPTHKGWK